MRILVVDDMPLMRQLMADVLDHPGVEVVCAGTLAEARTWFATQKVDHLVVDERLPDGRGRDLIAEARHHDPDLRVTVVSAEAISERFCQEVQCLGASAVFAKPITISAFRKAVLGEATPTLPSGSGSDVVAN